MEGVFLIQLCDYEHMYLIYIVINGQKVIQIILFGLFSFFFHFDPQVNSKYTVYIFMYVYVLFTFTCSFNT